MALQRDFKQLENLMDHPEQITIGLVALVAAGYLLHWIPEIPVKKVLYNKIGFHTFLPDPTDTLAYVANFFTNEARESLHGIPGLNGLELAFLGLKFGLLIRTLLDKPGDPYPRSDSDKVLRLLTNEEMKNMLQELEGMLSQPNQPLGQIDEPLIKEHCETVLKKHGFSGELLSELTGLLSKSIDQLRAEADAKSETGDDIAIQANIKPEHDYEILSLEDLMLTVNEMNKKNEKFDNHHEARLFFDQLVIKLAEKEGVNLENDEQYQGLIGPFRRIGYWLGSKPDDWHKTALGKLLDHDKKINDFLSSFYNRYVIKDTPIFFKILGKITMWKTMTRVFNKWWAKKYNGYAMMHQIAKSEAKEAAYWYQAAGFMASIVREITRALTYSLVFIIALVTATVYGALALAACLIGIIPAGILNFCFDNAFVRYYQGLWSITQGTINLFEKAFEATISKWDIHNRSPLDEQFGKRYRELSNKANNTSTFLEHHTQALLDHIGLDFNSPQDSPSIIEASGVGDIQEIVYQSDEQLGDQEIEDISRTSEDIAGAAEQLSDFGTFSHRRGSQEIPQLQVESPANDSDSQISAVSNT